MAAVVSHRLVPKAFVWRRLHSLMGLWFLIFLMEHLFTNSQAPIFFGANVLWFVNSVNFLHSIPYLPAVEIFLLGVPMGIHAVWGVKYMLSSKSNVRNKGGKASVLKYERNKAYSLQRISAWIILFGIILHVIQMRFVMYPYKIHRGEESMAFGKYRVDSGLYTVAADLKVSIYDQGAIEKEVSQLKVFEGKMSVVDERLEEMKDVAQDRFNKEENALYKSLSAFEDKEAFVKGLTHFTLKENEVIIASKKSADLILLNVREAFQSVPMCIFYTLFVLASVFHGSNGFWTFCITWGLILSRSAQTKWVSFAYGLAFVLSALGMLSIWGSYFFSTGYYH
jgi:succinate dehydrogenase / fumarate reductase cytochrome b subunit